MAALLVLDPSKAKQEIIEAFKRAKAHRGSAAQILGISPRTWATWVEKLGLRDKLEQIEATAEAEGWHHGRNRLGGRKPRET